MVVQCPPSTVQELALASPAALARSSRCSSALAACLMPRVVLPLCIPGLLTTGIDSFTPLGNEFLYALIFLTKSTIRTVRMAAISELIRGTSSTRVS